MLNYVQEGLAVHRNTDSFSQNVCAIYIFQSSSDLGKSSSLGINYLK